jgi:arginyl-tRNA synthetase
VVTDSLTELVRRALERAQADGALGEGDLPEPFFERPKNREHGDWATNIALVAAKGRGKPRDIAAAIKERLPESDLVSDVEIAGPGFLNFRLSPAWLHDVVRRAADPSSRFGFAPPDSKMKVNVEFVSANPTGPINVVSGRHAAAGDAIASLLEAAGYTVTREYYINDAGRQIRLFGESIAARYLQEHGRDAAVPEDGYQGEYLVDVAKAITAEVGARYVDADPEERLTAMRERGLALMLEEMKASLERFGTRYDVWFSEQSLHDSGLVMRTIEGLQKDGLVEERDGALFFLSSRFGDDKDRVVVRANGEPTYLASDLAYLQDKFGRGFDHLLYLWGADHHGSIARLLGGAEALGLKRDAVEVRLVQIVALLSGGETVKASKRAGAIVPLDELVADVGKDAVRYMMLSRSYEGPLDFDVELAKEQAPENPVFYVQYAHARICSILRKAELDGGVRLDDQADLSLLVHPSEDELMRKLASFEEVIPDAAELRAPQRLTRYIEELASTFSSFYRDCRVVTEDKELTRARAMLCVATKNVLAGAFGLLGVSAPESM